MFGKQTKIVYWCPFIVSIKQRIGNITHQCGGSILTRTLTLTAAHCLINGTQNMNLRFGSPNLFHGGTLIAATRAIIHNSFKWDTLASDIGLVSIFPTFLEYSDIILPVRLAKNFAVFEPSKQIVVYGWGAVSENEKFSLLLRSAILPIVDQKECRLLIKGTLPNKTFCLGYNDGHLDACEGDSGGPVISDGVQVGITSFGEGCGWPKKPGVYTNVTEYLDWIYFHMLTLL